MTGAPERLESVLRSSYPRLAALDESASSERPRGMTWSRKEILGHLIDSASNNHQRFVRAQISPPLSFPGYEQEAWVRTQDYAGRPWSELVLLWHGYNRHLVHVMSRIPSAAFANECVCPGRPDEPATLGDHMTDYVDHLEHHLGQILA